MTMVKFLRYFFCLWQTCIFNRLKNSCVDMKRRVILILTRALFLILFAIYPVFSGASVKQYVRDYSYQADEFDTRYTSRIRAIDGVKRSLIEELGTYVQSVIKLHEDADGNKMATHDMVALTAGVISTKILKEDWDRVVYYVKAGMEVDKDEVLRAIESLKKDYRIEAALR